MSFKFLNSFVRKKAFNQTLSLQSSSSSGTHVGGAPSQLQHEAAWSAGMPVLTPLHSQNATLYHTGPLASTSRGSAVSALLTHSSSNTNTTLLIPKTEKLSPVQLYSTDRGSLTGTAKQVGNLKRMQLLQLFYVVCWQTLNRENCVLTAITDPVWQPNDWDTDLKNVISPGLNSEIHGGWLWNTCVICCNSSRWKFCTRSWNATALKKKICSRWEIMLFFYSPRWMQK